MRKVFKTRKDKMGRLNNQIVGLIDKSDLTPIEVIVVMRQIANRIEELFEVSTEGKK